MIVWVHRCQSGHIWDAGRYQDKCPECRAPVFDVVREERP